MFDIPGRLYIPDYLAPARHDALTGQIDAQSWRTEPAQREVRSVKKGKVQRMVDGQGESND